MRETNYEEVHKCKSLKGRGGGIRVLYATRTASIYVPGECCLGRISVSRYRAKTAVFTLFWRVFLSTNLNSALDQSEWHFRDGHCLHCCFLIVHFKRFSEESKVQPINSWNRKRKKFEKSSWICGYKKYVLMNHSDTMVRVCGQKMSSSFIYVA